jgi:16S rRNA (uracil1498-N3)-methyltransferase
MTMHRFFIPPEWVSGARVTLNGPIVHQIHNVLRMRPGDHILVLDNSGWTREVELREMGSEQAVGQVVRRRLAEGEPRTKITLYQGVLKRRRFEFALQKGTELGIVEFVPLISDRAIIADLGDVDKRRTRWERIVQEAAEQSGRGRLPHLEPAMLFPHACEQAQRQGGLALIPWEEERSLSLRSVLARQQKKPFIVSLFIGPEGGFTADEAELARRYGVQTVTLGPRILRAETAGLVAATAILYELGDLE